LRDVAHHLAIGDDHSPEVRLSLVGHEMAPLACLVAANPVYFGRLPGDS
jgi:hypothetical protein